MQRSLLERLGAPSDISNITGAQDADMVTMFDMLRETKLAHCDEAFSNSSINLIINCVHTVRCDGLSGAFDLVRGQFEHQAAEILAETMLQNSVVRITSPEDFVLKA